MTRLWLAACLVLLGANALAQTPLAPDVLVPRQSIEAARSRIVSERAALEASFTAEHSACYSKFAVNYCLREVTGRRREAMAELRRQEILLNDEERKIRGEQEIQRIEEKTSPAKLEDASQRRAAALEESAARLQKSKEKAAGTAGQGPSVKNAQGSAAERLQEQHRKDQARLEKKTEAAERAKQFEERQKEARERRAAHEKNLLANPKAPAKPLPLPN